MNKIYSYEKLTHRGVRLLQILGNGMPSLHQMEFAQEIIRLLETDDLQPEHIENLFCKYEIQSRESLRRDNLHFRELTSI